MRNTVPGYDHEKGLFLTIEDGKTIKDVIDLLDLKDRVVFQFRNGRQTRPDEVVFENDVIDLFPAVGGG
ncbi:MAG: MoaD/ThiS family protein [Bacillota bacterium]|uniref:MoaD/ThiS family protein n=1 Tax=Desulforudis sp. DRI-14 TaxID=3459793 RepID=UPI0034735E22